MLVFIINFIERLEIMVRKISKTACTRGWEKKGENVLCKTLMNIPFEIHKRDSIFLLVGGKVIFNCDTVSELTNDLFLVLQRVEKELPKGYTPVGTEKDFLSPSISTYMLNETDEEWIEEIINSACFHVKKIIEKLETEKEVDGIFLSTLFYSIGYHLFR